MNGLEAGLAQSRENGKPILVRVGAEWCGWCKKLDVEIAAAATQKELARWTLVYIDADHTVDDLDALSVGPIPALRVLTPTGRVVASQDGYMTASALTTWLAAQHEQAAVAAPDELKNDVEPTPELLAKLLRQFENRDPLLREAAIRRLAGYPDLAAPEVVKAFSSGRLAVRLTSLELLESWKAPLAQMDPWRPDTLTGERLAALAEWAGRPGKAPASQPAELDALTFARARDELDAYLRASAASEVQAARERLARYGPALLPEVLERLKVADSDDQRERIGALRYRLAASDSLALRWPGGFERLASTSASVCEQATEELGRLASSADTTLLLELFGHPDALVRENSLRMLQTVGGTKATDALVRLLNDPEPNVRAAVLKQLAEKPNARLVPQIAAYVEKETDADLVAHAARFLRAAKGPAAVDCLSKLLAHESWRVRAEAAEALGECMTDSDSISPEKRVEINSAFVRLLDDPDGFVVSRAVAALRYADVSAAREALGRAASEHPELAAEITELMTSRSYNQSADLSQFRPLVTHADPLVRAAGIQGLAAGQAPDIASVLTVGLQDADRHVRITSANALLETLEHLRPREQMEFEVVQPRRTGLMGALFGGGKPRPVSRPAESRPTDEAGRPLGKQTAWLLAFRAGQGRPEWLNEAVPPLEAMLVAADVDERVAATVPLIAVGRDGAALPVLMAESLDSTAVQSKAVAALPWLPWERRVELFNHLSSLSQTTERSSELAAALVKIPDPRAGRLLWDLLARPGFAEDGLSAVYESLLTFYFGEYNWNLELVAAERRKAAETDGRQYAETGTYWQRLVGLTLLVTADRAQAAEITEKLLAEASTESDLALQRDLIRLILLAQAPGKTREVALEWLSKGKPEQRKAALHYFSRGSSSLALIRDRMYVRVTFDADPSEFVGMRADQPIKPTAPEGLTAEAVRPWLKDADPGTAAVAGYLLALLGEPEGLGPLLEYWRTHAKQDYQWTRMAYRGVAALNDEDQLPVLKEIYESMEGEEYRTREFYWTVRSMKGKKVVAFREQVRKDIWEPPKP